MNPDNDFSCCSHGATSVLHRKLPVATRTRYTFGFNTHGTAKHEVLLVNETENGDFLGTEVALTVPSKAKAEAIAMILNAPENY